MRIILAGWWQRKAPGRSVLMVARLIPQARQPIRSMQSMVLRELNSCSFPLSLQSQLARAFGNVHILITDPAIIRLPHLHGALEGSSERV